MRTLLLDSDIIAFKVAATHQSETAFGLHVDDFDDAAYAVDKEIARLKKLLGADEVIACLSCREYNWRYDVLPTYKERDHSKRPVHLQPLKDYMEFNYPSRLEYGLEADDVMGILSTHPTLVEGEKVIVSEDKDMRTVPGLLYAPHRATLGIQEITPLQARQFHLWQSICGDVTDGYKGVPGLGKSSVWAEAVLEEEFEELWSTVLLAFGSKGLTEVEALQQARVAQILTHSWYDFKAKETVHFEPEFLEIF